MSFLDRGRSGANDLSQNDVESLPGPTNTVDHLKRRPRVCVMCGVFHGRRYTRVLNLTDTAHAALASQISVIMQHWSVTDARLPCGLCSKCNTTLARATTGKASASKLSTITYIDGLYATLIANKHYTRTVCPGADGDCLVCHASQRNAHQQQPQNSRNPPDEKQAQASVEDIADNANSVAESAERKTLSHAFMYDVQSELGLSDRMLLRLAQKLRNELGTQIIEPNFRRNTDQRNLRLSDLFEQCEFHEHPAVFCSDCAELLARISAERRHDIADIDLIKINIDSGRGSLKVTMNVLYDDERTTPRYKSGRRIFKESGVKRSFLLAIIPNIGESYAIISDLVRTTSLPNQKWVLCGDLKMVNIAIGIQSHSATYPCPYCHWRSGGHERDMVHLVYRTFEGIKQLSDEYRARFEDLTSPASRKHLKDFFGCEFPPIKGMFPESGRVIEHIPITELHLLLGVVNKMISEFVKHPSTRFRAIARKWQASLSVAKADYRDEYNGNDCAAFISEDGVRSLQAVILETRSARVTSLSTRKRKASHTTDPVEAYVEAFAAFGKLVRGIFGSMLAARWHTLINDFCRAYLDLNISVTPKVHIIFTHLKEWIESSNSALGRFSEQAGEAIHSDFDRKWQHFYMRSRTWQNDAELSDVQQRQQNAAKAQWSDQYGRRLLHCTTVYNAGHL